MSPGIVYYASSADCCNGRYTFLKIEKHQKGTETITEIHPLEGDDSVRELARLLGGAELTQAVFENAKEMKELARVHKNTRLK